MRNNLVYICDCSKGFDQGRGGPNYKADQGKGVFSEVRVDADECCVHCGHVAFAGQGLKENARGAISPPQYLASLYGSDRQKEIRKTLENGQLHNSFNNLNEAADYWAPDKWDEEKAGSWKISNKTIFDEEEELK